MRTSLFAAIGILTAFLLLPGPISVCAQDTPVSPAAQLLNASFEDAETAADNPYGDLAAHWGRWGNWMNREAQWAPVHGGKCMVGYHHWEIKETSSSGLYQDVPGTAPDRTYTFTVHAFKDDKTNVGTVELRLEKLNGGEILASKTYSCAEIPTGSWDPISVTGKSPGEGLRVVIVVTPAQSDPREGCVKFDDATLTSE